MTIDTSSVSRPLAIFDLDGTITHRDTFVLYLTGYLRRRPSRLLRCIGLPISMLLHYINMRSTDETKRRFVSAILAGEPRSALSDWTSTFVERILQSEVREGARREIERHRREGAELLLATAGLDLYATEIGKQLGFDSVIATRCGWTEHETISQEFGGPNLKGHAKLSAVIAHLSGSERLAMATAYSDSWSDLPLLQSVRTGYFVSKNLSEASRASALGLRIVDWSTHR